MAGCKDDEPTPENTGNEEQTETPADEPSNEEEPVPEPVPDPDPNSQPNADTPTELNEYKPISLTSGEAAVAENSAHFAFDLLSAVLSNNEKASNVLLSPMSASFALSMAANGAKDNLQSEIISTLACDGISIDDFNSLNAKLMRALPEIDNSAQVSIANSMWLDPSLTLLDSYRDILDTWYGSEYYTLNESTFIKDINAWCEARTNGMIKDFLKKGEQYYDFRLMNALYFKGIWADGYKFNKALTKKETFYGKNLSVYAEFMHNRNYLTCYASSFAEACVLPFGNGAYSFNLILPNDGYSVGECVENLRGDGWKEMTATAQLWNVNLSLPKFEVGDKYELTQPLKEIGMTDLDTERIPNITTIDLIIKRVDQKTKFKIDEEGVTAAAVTDASMDAICPEPDSTEPYPMTFNKPFIYAIAEKSTGVILFVGVIDKL